jgi:multiple sugar transport system substrate-binding protein
VKLSIHNRSVYITATLVLLPVLVLLVACQSSPQPTPSVDVTPTRTSSPVTPAATRSTPISASSTPPPATATTCLGSQCFTPTNSPTATTTATSSLGVGSGDLDGLTLQFWYIAQVGDVVGVLPALVSEFNKTNSWGIQIEITAFDNPGQLSEQVRSVLYSGKLPDVLSGYSYQETAWDKNAKTLVDLNTYITDAAWGLSLEDQADFFQAFWLPASPGKRLGIPLHRSALGLYYNSTWAKELGYSTPPTTPQEFEQQACAAAKNHVDGTGGWMITSETSTLVGWMYAFGGTLVSPDGKGYQIDTPENLQALTFLKRLKTQGCAWTTPQLYPLGDFTSRRALFVVGGTTGIASQEAEFKSSGNGDQWTVIPFPAEEDIPNAGKPVVITHGPDLIIPRTTPQRQLAAWLFARWLISPEIQSRWVRADGSFPVRAATLNLLSDYAATHPQWAALVELSDEARAEPIFASWEIVRWVISDAAAQLFSSMYKEEDIPDLLKMLEKTADEAHVQVR